MENQPNKERQILREIPFNLTTRNVLINHRRTYSFNSDENEGTDSTEYAGKLNTNLIEVNNEDVNKKNIEVVIENDDECNSSLPDIINVQHSLNDYSYSPEKSVLSKLTDDFNCLHLNSPYLGIKNESKRNETYNNNETFVSEEQPENKIENREIMEADSVRIDHRESSRSKPMSDDEDNGKPNGFEEQFQSPGYLGIRNERMWNETYNNNVSEEQPENKIENSEIMEADSIRIDNNSSKPRLILDDEYNGNPDDIEEEFKTPGLILSENDFNDLLSKGGGDCHTINDRSSLLLTFDPLLGHLVPNNQHLSQQKQGINETNPEPINKIINKTSRLSPTLEDDDSCEAEHKTLSLDGSSITNSGHNNFSFEEFSTSQQNVFINSSCSLGNADNCSDLENHISSTVGQELIQNLENSRALFNNNVSMSAEVINNDIKNDADLKSIDNNLCSEANEKIQYRMTEIEKKIKNEGSKIEDIEKKLKDAEQREEVLLKRITEKDKAILKMSGVMEVYEKTIAELIAEKEQIIQKYVLENEELKKERDLNYKHLTSLEETFSDQHAKYERSKQITASLKVNEELLLNERKQNLENLRLQEERYEKMRNHAVQQLEIANNKLESLSSNHSTEITKLKALLKKEEISRLSLNEQLLQKVRENEELVKICDELIKG